MRLAAGGSGVNLSRGPKQYILVGVAALTLSAASAAKAEVPIGPKWRPHVDINGKAGPNRQLGYGDAFLPLWQDEETLLFADLRAMGDNTASIEGNFGLGVRKIFDASYILGGSGFYDYRSSDHFGDRNHFMGGTLGAEFLTEDYDVRANVYIPQGAKRNAPDASKVNLIGTSLIVERGKERAMYGGDAEVGVRLPFSEDSAFWDTRAYAGGYFFNRTGTNSFGGPRGRVETRIHDIPFLPQGSRFTIGSEVGWDSYRGVTYLATAGIRIPLVWPGSNIRELTKLERRMVDPIVRDVDIRTRLDAWEEMAINPKTGDYISKVLIASADVEGGQGGGIETKLPGGDGGQNGRWSNPRELQDALDHAGESGIVVARGDGGTYDDPTYQMHDGQYLIGEGQTIWVKDSSDWIAWTAPGSTSKRPEIDGLGGTALRLAPRNLVQGVDFINYRTGIEGGGKGAEGGEGQDIMLMDLSFFTENSKGVAIDITAEGGEGNRTRAMLEDISIEGGEGGIKTKGFDKLEAFEIWVANVSKTALDLEGDKKEYSRAHLGDIHIDGAKDGIKVKNYTDVDISDSSVVNVDGGEGIKVEGAEGGTVNLSDITIHDDGSKSGVVLKGGMDANINNVDVDNFATGFDIDAGKSGTINLSGSNNSTTNVPTPCDISGDVNGSIGICP